jgi:hypothetical protein
LRRLDTVGVRTLPKPTWNGNMELGCRVTRTSSSTVLESSLPGHEAATLENLIRNEMKRQNLDRKLN